jgi:hypothetical protein
MLPHFWALSTSLVDDLRKTELLLLASKPVLLAAFIVSDLDSDQLSERCILAQVIGTILFLGGSAPAVPNLGQVTNVYDGFGTRIYTEQISASLQCGRGLDSRVFTQPV